MLVPGVFVPESAVAFWGAESITARRNNAAAPILSSPELFFTL
jgi:hypothetical protein